MKEREWQIRWSDTLRGCIPEIDKEHQQFIARVNELDSAILDCEEKSTVKRLLVLMVTQAKRRRWQEQQLLAGLKYPDSAARAAAQTQLEAKIDRVMKAFDQADVSFTWALKGLYIKQLLVDHLLKEDFNYRDFSRKQRDPIPGQNRSRRKSEETLLPN